MLEPGFEPGRDIAFKATASTNLCYSSVAASPGFEPGMYALTGRRDTVTLRGNIVEALGVEPRSFACRAKVIEPLYEAPAAERAGFEPAQPKMSLAAIAGRCLTRLGHRSKVTYSVLNVRKVWGDRWDSNPLHPEPQSGASPLGYGHRVLESRCTTAVRPP